MAVMETFFFFLPFVRWVPKTAKFHPSSLKGRLCSAELYISHCTDTAHRETQAQKFPKWFSTTLLGIVASNRCGRRRKQKEHCCSGSWEENEACGMQRALLVFSLQVSWFLLQFCYLILVWPRAGHLTLMKLISKFCYFMDYTVHGIPQARILEWVAFPFSRGSSQPRDQTQVYSMAGGFFPSWATREAQEDWSG